MKIIVCVKQVLDTAAKINIKNGAVDAENIPRILNPYDEFAVEEAIRIKEKRAGSHSQRGQLDVETRYVALTTDTIHERTIRPHAVSEVVLITLGPEKVREVLRTGLAMGADQAVHLMDPAFDGLDHLGIARVLAKTIQSMPYDLILCGRQAVDDDMAQVGPALAVLLGIPCVTVATRLELADGPLPAEDGKRATVTRQIEGGTEILESSMPLVVTCQKGLNTPRLPSLKGIMAAKKKEIKVLDAKSLGLDAAAIDSKNNKVRVIDLSLPPGRKKGIILEGTAQESASKLVKILREDVKAV